MIPISPFTCRFNTDFQPTEEERKQICRIILTSLDEHSRLDALIHNLTVRRGQFQQHIENHQRLVAPIRRVPVEILQRIFYYCLPPHNVVMSPKEAPLLLGRVCGAWRQISFSAPHLWSTLHIDNLGTGALPGSGKKRRLYCEAIEAWLQRSYSLPLSISLADSWGRWTLPLELIDVLVKFSPRWKHLAVKLPRYNSLCAIKDANAPLLTTVTMDIEERPSEAELEALLFLQTSSLRSVSLPYSTSLSIALPIQWGNVTDLSVGSQRDSHILTVPRVFGILRMCPNLASCRFEVGMKEPFENDIINLSCLKILRLTLYLSGEMREDVSPLIASFFGSLDMPSLSHLDFEATNTGTVTVPFKSILEQPNIIDTLEYTVGNVSANNLVEALTPGSRLRRLRLAVQAPQGYDSTSSSGSALNNEFLTRLSSTSEFPACPSLEEIDMRIDSNSDITEEKLLQFILSRTDQAAAGITRLKRARFAFDRPRRVDIIPDLHAAVERGLQVQISYPLVESPGSAWPLPINPVGDINLAEQSGEYDNGFWEPKA